MNQPEVQLSNKGFSTCMNLSGVFTSGQRGIYLQLDKSSAISAVNAMTGVGKITSGSFYFLLNVSYVSMSAVHHTRNKPLKNQTHFEKHK